MPRDAGGTRRLVHTDELVTLVKFVAADNACIAFRSDAFIRSNTLASVPPHSSVNGIPHLVVFRCGNGINLSPLSGRDEYAGAFD